jgi:hypothetical protein
MRKSAVAVFAALVMTALGATSALGAPQPMASGGGKTHVGASFGFNAKDDEQGSFNYVGLTQFQIVVAGKTIPVGSSFHGHCFDYTRVNFISNVEARLFAGCRGFFFVNGGPPIRGKVYLQAHVIDNGEPGTKDRACIAWGLNPPPGQGKPGLFVRDCGLVQNGNIQVKP